MRDLFLQFIFYLCVSRHRSRRFIKMDGADSFKIDFNKWNDKNKPCIDDDNGFADEKCGDAEEETEDGDK